MIFLMLREITKMPKGALLHVHLDLTVNGNTLLALALQHSSIHIRASARVTPDSIESVEIECRPLPSSFVPQCISLCLPTYKPGQWIPLRRAREQFDAALDGTQGFDRWLATCLTINPNDAYITHNDNIRVCHFASCQVESCTYNLHTDMGQIPCSCYAHKSEYPYLGVVDTILIEVHRTWCTLPQFGAHISGNFSRKLLQMVYLM
jgi:hypothetical protein